VVSAIQLFVPTFAIDECLAEIRECLERGWTGLGYKTVEFEKEWGDYARLPHSHFLNSATSGLHLALNIYKEVFGWADGDEIITTPLTFVSANSAILYERMTPVFADVDSYLCLDPADVRRKISPRTRAVIFAGIGGNTGQLGQVRSLCREHGLKLILDAAHMAGTREHGATPRADVSVYSFQAVKNLPTADAGMICFEEPELDALARRKSWLGISKDTYARTSGNATYKWLYDVDTLGFKYHGNSIMAAMALVQLRSLERDNERRREMCDWYDGHLRSDERIRRVPVAPGCLSARHLYQIEVPGRDDVIVDLNKHDIFPGVHYRDNREYSIFRQPSDTCPNATRASQHIISLPLHLRLSREDVARVSERVIAALG
jgi:dTDP-4-amino-4,6-dideoxygalactose transaminase